MHALEQGSKGQVAFASRKEPAWHGLGTVFSETEKVDTAGMLAKAHLSGWNVRLAEIGVVGDTIATESGDVVTVVETNFVSAHLAVLRDNPFEANQTDCLAVVGGRYTVVQNEDLFGFGDALLDGGGEWETAGSIRDGRVVFGSLALPREIIIGGNDADDRVKTYLLVTTSHDGTVGVMAATTPVRVVCQNTLNMALRGVKQSFKMRHTQTVAGRVAAAREALALSYKYADAFEAEANALYQTEMTNTEFFNVVSDLYPKPENDSKGAMTRWDSKISLLSDLFVGDVSDYGAPNTVANIAGTAWAGLNALTERLDWYRNPRGGNPDSVFEAASGFVPVQNAEKARIHKAILAFAKDKGADVKV